MILYLINNSECNVIKKIGLKTNGLEIVVLKKHEISIIKKEFKLDKIDFPLLEFDDGSAMQNVFTVNRYLKDLK